jgi:hypothetical protein
VAVATSVLINGDGAYNAAPVVKQDTFATQAGVQSSAAQGKFNLKTFAAWLISRAKLGVPIDTVVGNWDLYLAWLMFFYLPESDATVANAESAARMGVNVSTSNRLDLNVQFNLSTTVPANQLIGYSKADTLEELVEAGSLINESETSIQTQEVTYVRTENSGFKLAFGDTRSILDLTAT